MSQLDFQPIGDRIIVRAWSEEELRTKSGILISVRDDVNKELPQCGEVVALGTGGTFPDCPDPTKVFEIGDFVYFNRYAGEEIVVGNSLNQEENEKFTVLRLDAIFGKLGKELVAKMIEHRERLRKIANEEAKVEVEKPSTFDKKDFNEKILMPFLAKKDEQE